METLKGFSSYEFRQLKRRVIKSLRDGLEIGFFEMRVKGKVSKNGKKRVQILFAPVEQFTIPEDENEVN